MAERRLLNLTRLGWGLALPVALLVGVGLACIHATDRTATPATQLTPPTTSDVQAWTLYIYHVIGPYTTKQIAFTLTGVGLMLLAMKIGYHRVSQHAYIIYGFVILLLIVLVLDRYVDIPFVPVSRNTRRWLEIFGVRLQPSEFMKLALVICLASYLRFRDSYRTWSGLITPFVLTLVPMGLIMLQPDLGTLLMLLPVLLALLFVAGARLRHLAAVIIAGTLLAVPFYAYGMEAYQKQRVEVLLRQNVNNEAWHMDEGYQLRQSKMALATGGLLGQGYRAGIFVEYDGLLPEEHNDFIFAIIGHQWGLVGGLVILAAYGFIVIFGIEVTTVTNDPFGRLLAVGIIAMIVLQGLLNIGMTLGLAPITGMTLPFVSAGGSSLWANFIALGLLVSVAQRRPMLISNRPFEFRDER